MKMKRGGLVSVLPMHGAGKDLGSGLVNAIKRHLGLKGRVAGRKDPMNTDTRSHIHSLIDQLPPVQLATL